MWCESWKALARGFGVRVGELPCSADDSHHTRGSTGYRVTRLDANKLRESPRGNNSSIPGTQLRFFLGRPSQICGFLGSGFTFSRFGGRSEPNFTNLFKLRVTSQ